jgi:putative DNA primase/helicase
MIDETHPPALGWPMDASNASGMPSGRVTLTPASSIKPVAIRWLWPGWLARGKLHLIAGSGGTGKTTIAVAIASIISRGGILPDGTKAPAGSVLIWSGEDALDDGLVPRLCASGADQSRIFFISGTDHGGRNRPFDPAADMDRLATEAKSMRPALLILDPILSAVSGDSHKAAEVRRGLQPVVDLAMDLDCAVLGITHFGKGTAGRDVTERVLGSQAFGALARVVLATVAPDDPEEPRRLVRSKSNIGPDGGGFEYTLRRVTDTHGVTGQTVEWGGVLEGGARDLIAEVEGSVVREDQGPGPSVSKAMDFLQTTLADGPCRAIDVQASAKACGLLKRSVDRARKRLGVIATRKGGAAGAGWWEWSLPGDEAGAAT